MDGFECRMRVQFTDVDIHNRLTMKGMLRLMQEAANLHSDQVGYGLNNIEETDFSWVLYEQRCRLYRRPRWNTQLSIRTWSRGANGVICLRDFEVFDEEGEPVAIGATGWLLVSASSQKMAHVPEDMLAKYGMEERSVFGEPLKRLRAPAAGERLWDYTVQRRDIDINRHANNLCYLDYALEALPEEAAKQDFDEVEIMYKKASYAGDRIACFGGLEAPASSFTIAVKDDTGGLLHAVIRLTSLQR